MNNEVERTRLLAELNIRLSESPVTILLGARQTGKTTLARMAARKLDIVRFFDLEVAADRTALPGKVLRLNRRCLVLVIGMPGFGRRSGALNWI